MNITEKILAKASAKKTVQAGEIVDAKVDMVMVHDLTGPLAVEAFKKIGVKNVWDNQKVVVILDHQVPAESVKAAELHKMMRSFAKEQKIRLYDVGKGGICHQVMPEKGHVLPGRSLLARTPTPALTGLSELSPQASAPQKRRLCLPRARFGCAYPKPSK